MNRKEYELIANTLKTMQWTILDGNRWDDQPSDYDNVCLDFASALADNYTNFDRERFLKACEVEEWLR